MQKASGSNVDESRRSLCFDFLSTGNISKAIGVVGLVVRISAFQADGPGSIPGRRSNLFRRYVRLCEESPQNAQFLEFSMLGWLVVLPSSVMLGLMHLPSLLGCKGSCVHRKLEVGFPGGRVAQWIRRRSSEPKIVGSSPTVVIL